MALKRLFDHGEQICAAHQKFDRLVQHVQHLAQGVFQGPGQADRLQR